MPHKSNFVFVFEILGIIFGGFWGYLIAMSVQASVFDLASFAGTLFLGIIFGGIYGKMFLILSGAPVGYLLGHFLKQKKLGIEIGLIIGMIILTPIFLREQILIQLYFVSYVCMIIGIFVGKVIGTKIGIILDENNDVEKEI